MNGHVILPGTPRDRFSLPLATKRGTPIPNERRLERPPDSLRAAVDFWAHERPNARLRSVGATYNCVGLVFASRRTWVDPQHVPLILEEDGYHEVPRHNRLQPGDVVIYRSDGGEITHIGIVLAAQPEVETATWEVTVLSQWGGDGEYIHAADYIPHLLGRPSEYWSERRQVP